MRRSVLKNPADKLTLARLWQTLAEDADLAPQWRAVMVKDVVPGPFAGDALVLSCAGGLLSLFCARRLSPALPPAYVLAHGDIRTTAPRAMPPVELTTTDGQQPDSSAVEELLSAALHATAAAGLGVLRGTDPLEGVDRPAGSRS